MTNDQLVVRLARLAGCTCNPDTDTTTDAYGVEHVVVRHDPECPLLTRIERRN
jgi:hypothetical protein